MDSALSTARRGPLKEIRKSAGENRGGCRDREEDRALEENERPKKNARRTTGDISRDQVWGGEPIDPQLKEMLGNNSDPRVNAPLGKAQRALLGMGVASGRNTESFDPSSTRTRPMMRIRIGSSRIETFDGELSHDDVVLVPEFFCAKDDWSIYYKLIKELGGTNHFIPWHEGSHLCTKKPESSVTYGEIQKKMAQYFRIQQKDSAGTRFNWYINDQDWKPAHHDSAAFNRDRALRQNCTVGVSFGSTRELFFCDANDSSKRFYFPQDNGMLYFFGRDVNIRFKHGINQIPPEKRDGKGRISIILWGMASGVIDEPNSPPMLTDESRPVYDGRDRQMSSSHIHARPIGRDICRDFSRRGFCSRGNNCRFLH
eukprot:CAMPEP_0197316702 /NCGR_PEP_ID=MMETSP0891-20130614/43748_1 /TAXON_ID=44058 ORGANISM="Aureoumbra lagunensis, Strain CCMP1510" /NCGR_SAMPLE_ID=MMETSP0891 /ASSEMBLY_ACC=CAM_ASM_000534 /LENGTH=370 /DNA_ID=CAMNT_0042806305 /DNA_START=57 /DNA_END=1169 /DNA_ORIENTATION=+